jgi:DNA-binding GntR family transcriptional regulator
MLEAEELVVCVPNRGTIVRITPGEVRETYDQRPVLRGAPRSAGGSRVGVADLGCLRRLLRELRRALSRSDPDEDRRVEELASLNEKFPGTPAAAAGNRVGRGRDELSRCPQEEANRG